jgi:glycosyltransferase involved in cell wall biosynthesis
VQLGSGTPRLKTIALVANFSSDAGYAWWLMERFWVNIALAFRSEYKSIVAYPKLNEVPPSLLNAGITAVQQDLTTRSEVDLRTTLRVLARNGVRLLYLTDQPAVSLRYLLYRIVGVKWIVIHDHTPGHRTPPSGIKRTIKSLLARTPWISADALISCTQFVEHRHREVICFPAAKLFVSANGIDPIEANEGADVHEYFGVPRHRHVLVSVSRAHPVKQIERILDGVAKVIHDHGREDLHLIHFGDGPSADALRSHTEALGIASYVTFAGRVERPSRFLRGCAMGIHLSSAEVGYSLSILEMMRAGLPTIVNADSSVSGATIDGETGYCVDPTDSAAVADRIVYLLESPEHRKGMGRAAAEVQSQRFGIDRTIHSLCDALTTVVTTTH